MLAGLDIQYPELRNKVWLTGPAQSLEHYEMKPELAT